jgi:hypothetical protein
LRRQGSVQILLTHLAPFIRLAATATLCLLPPRFRWEQGVKAKIMMENNVSLAGLLEPWNRGVRSSFTIKGGASRHHP